MRQDPTVEQQAFIQATLEMVGSTTAHDGSIKALAGAGSGKTTTLINSARTVIDHYPKARILYLAYNREIKEEAAIKFKGLADTYTVHGLAHKMLKLKSLGRRLGNIHTGIVRDILGTHVSDSDVALVQMALTNFCQQGDSWTSIDSIPKRFHGVKVSEDRRAGLVDSLERLFLELCPENTKTDHPCSFDIYLKYWQIVGAPGLSDYDLVAMDEAQDANPVVLAAMEGAGRSVYVGDSHQALYGWRMAVDALKSVYGDTYPMTQSFRFGHTIAAVANAVLDCKHDKPLHLVRGTHIHDSYIGRVDRQRPHARLYRTNRTLIREAMVLFDRRIPFAIAGNNDEVALMIESVWALKNNNKRGVRHPLVRYLGTWEKALEAADEDESARELSQAVKIVEEFQTRVPEVIQVLREFKNESSARVVMSTAHRSKGREWECVVISSDFDVVVDRAQKNRKLWDAEMNLLYVAATRAMICLEVQSEWLNGLLRKANLIG